MWTLSDDAKLFGKGFLRLAAILLVAGSLAAPAIAAPVPQSAALPAASAEERAELRRNLESRYEVLPVTGGIALKPRKARAGIRTIEVMAGQDVAVNGERVTARTLRDWLGEDAGAVLRLQGLSAAEQRRMFGLDDTAAAAGQGEEPTPEPAQETAADEDESAATSDAGVAEVPELPERPEAPEPPEIPERVRRHNSGSRVNVGGNVRVEKDEVVEEAVAVGGSATIDGEVTDSVTAIGGDVRIKGRVGGEVTSVGRDVYLGPNAVVEGNVTSVGGSIHREPGSQIHGEPSEVLFAPWPHRGWRFGRHRDSWPFWGGVSDVMGSLMGLILMGLLTCLVLLVARRPLERVDRQLTAQPWQSALAGLAGVVFFWPLFFVVTVLLAITIIGCALFLLYPFLFLYLGLLLILGYAAVAYRLGRWIEIRFNQRFGGPYVVALVGVLLIQVWSLLGHVFDLIPFFGFFAFLTELFGFLVQATAWIVGFGAVILSRFGMEPGYWPQRGAPVPPPSYTPPPPADRPAEPLPLSDPLTEERWEEPGAAYPGDYPPEPPR